jgi:hypothetical protein
MAGRGKPSGAKELAETLRNAARRAIRGLDDDGVPLSTLIKDAIKKSPLDAIRALASLIPKNIEVSHRSADPFDDLTDEELDSFIAEARVLAKGREKPALPAGTSEPDVVH